MIKATLEKIPCFFVLLIAFALVFIMSVIWLVKQQFKKRQLEGVE